MYLLVNAHLVNDVIKIKNGVPLKITVNKEKLPK